MPDDSDDPGSPGGAEEGTGTGSEESGADPSPRKNLEHSCLRRDWHWERRGRVLPCLFWEDPPPKVEIMINILFPITEADQTFSFAKFTFGRLDFFKFL